ncbi:MAG: shikimate dehydrogenase [Geminicoccaceae bacterium]
MMTLKDYTLMISGKARLAGVMGWPVSHSLSPRLHNHWMREAGTDGAYVPLPVRPDDLADAVRLLPRLGFRGFNVTIPHKTAMFELVDAHDPAASRMRAVNTVLVQDDGSLLGCNTDAYGFMANLRNCAKDWDASRGPAVIIGTGGAASAVAAGLVEAGIGGLRLVNRTRARAEALGRQIAAWGNVAIEVVDWERRGEALDGAGICVQCSSLGMHGQPPLEIDLSALPVDAPVADIVYVPLVTGILADARRRGHPVVDGLGMLIHQAVPGFRHWGGAEPRVDAAVRTLMLAT